MKYLLLTLCLFIMANHEIKAQCPVITCPSTLSIPCSTNGLGQPVTATSNYSANVSSQWYFQGGTPIWSTGTSTSVVYINHVGTYSVQFTDNTSGCITTQTIAVSGATNSPTFLVTALPSFSQGCSSSFVVLNIQNQNTNPVGGGAMTFALNLDKNTPPVFGPYVDYTVTTCGSAYAMAMDMNNNCISSFDVEIFCPQTISLNISGPPGNTVCVGSGAILTATSNAVYNLWSTGENTLSITVPPSQTTGPIIYSLTASNNNGGNCPVVGVYTLNVIDCLPTNTNTSVGFSENTSLKNSFSLFPNPASSQLTMKTNFPSEINYTLYDIIGKEIAKGTFVNSKNLNVSAFDNGTYLLKLQTGEETLYRKVIVKN